MTPEVEKRLQSIPDRMRSAIIRSLIKAYSDLEYRVGAGKALGATLKDNIVINLEEK